MVRACFPKARFLESASSLMWKFPGGERLMFRKGADESDYWNHHGKEYPFLGFEELTREFYSPRVTYTGGAGALFRLELHPRPSQRSSG